jgi:hypothetical protein
MAYWLRHQRGDVGRPPPLWRIILPCRLRRTRRIKDLHVTRLKTILTVWRRLWEATNCFLRKKKLNSEWWLRDQTVLVSKIMAMTGWTRLLPQHCSSSVANICWSTVDLHRFTIIHLNSASNHAKSVLAFARYADVLSSRSTSIWVH